MIRESRVCPPAPPADWDNCKSSDPNAELAAAIEAQRQADLQPPSGYRLVVGCLVVGLLGLAWTAFQLLWLAVGAVTPTVQGIVAVLQ